MRKPTPPAATQKLAGALNKARAHLATADQLVELGQRIVMREIVRDGAQGHATFGK